jgi:hypothetical protein
LEHSFTERNKLVQKFGRELGLQGAKYKSLQQDHQGQVEKYNRQVQLNAQLEQELFQLEQDYKKLRLRLLLEQQQRLTPPQSSLLPSYKDDNNNNNNNATEQEIMEA